MTLAKGALAHDSKEVKQKINFGYCTFVGGNLTTWLRKNRIWWLEIVLKQSLRWWHIVYVKLYGLNSFLKNLKATSPLSMDVFCDNKVTIAIAHDLLLHDRTKYLEVNTYFIKEKLEIGFVVMSYISMFEQVAILSKGLLKKQVDKIGEQTCY